MALAPLICIMEDDAAVRDSLRLMLELHGYDVEEFADRSEFLTRKRFDDVSCLILDLNLPGESGLQILARLRAQGLGVPAFIMTGRADSSARREAQRLGAFALFEKPLAPRELLAAIDTIRKASAQM
jgi:FixJ family two-component response regulator